jgi:uncharacterized protein (TIGR02147 family)
MKGLALRLLYWFPMKNVVVDERKPKVFDFTDYRRYLKAFYDWQKLNGFYSHREFCIKAGLKSRSYLRLVLSGKRNLTPESISKFIIGLDLRSVEAEAFTSLVLFNQAQDFDARKHYWEVFSKYRPRNVKSQKVHDVYSYLTRMTYPILLNILRKNHVAQDRQSLMKMTGLTAAQLDEAIEVLTQLGAVVRTSETEFKVTCASFNTGDDISSIAIPTFHKNMLKVAQEKTTLPQTEREFQSVMVSLDQEEFTYIKKKLRELAIEFDEKFSGVRPQSDKVYAINLNLIPVTPEFIRKDHGHIEKTDAHASQKTEAATHTMKEVSS